MPPEDRRYAVGPQALVLEEHLVGYSVSVVSVRKQGQANRTHQVGQLCCLSSQLLRQWKWNT